MEISTSSPTNPADAMESDTPARKHGRIAVNFSWLMAGEVAAKGFAFISTVYLARVLGKGDFGLFSFATALLTYGMLLTDFGLSTYGTREIAGRCSDLRRCISNVQSTRLALSVILLVVGTTAMFLISHDRRLQLLITFSLMSLIPYALGSDWIFRGLEKMGYSALGNVVQQVVSLAPILLFVAGPAQLLSVPIFRTIGWVAASGVLMFFLRKITGCTGFAGFAEMPKPKAIGNMLRAGIPLAATYLMVQVYCNIDTVILGIVDKPAAVGIYSAAYRVVTLANCFCYTLTAAFYPSLSHDHRHDPKSYRTKLSRMLVLVSALGFLGMTCTFLLRHFIVSVLYGQGYEGAAIALSVLCMAILGDYVTAALGAGFLSAGFDKLVLVAVATGGIPNIILNFILIPKYSFMGAAIATVVSYTLMALFYLANLHRLYPKEVS